MTHRRTKLILTISGLALVALVALWVPWRSLPAVARSLVSIWNAMASEHSEASRAAPASTSEAAGTASTGSADTDTEASPVASVRLPVTGVVLQRTPFVVTIRGTGRAEAVERAALSPRAGERIVRVPVREGDRVRRGETLVELDARPFTCALKEAEARVVSAEVDYQRQLFADSSASEEKRTRVAHLTGLTEAEQGLERARLDLEGSRIAAPFDGEVVEVDAAVGELAVAGRALVTLVSLEPIRVPVEILESDFGSLSPGAAASVHFAALPEETFRGTVRALRPEIDPQRGTGIAYIELPNSGGHIKPGMYCEAEIAARSYESRLSVPRSALLERSRRLLVFRVKEGKAEWTYVETGLETEDRVEITSGLAPGDTVLTEGHLTLAHGAPVRVSIASP